MSKKHIEAVVRAQYKAMNAKDNKERLKYMIAGIKDGKFYNYASGEKFGVFDLNVPDTVFIPEETLDLARVTGAKLATLTQNMERFFDEYYGQEREDTDPTRNPLDDEPEGGLEDEPKSDTAGKELEEAVKFSDEVVDDLVAECKKAIKKGNFKKAHKILAKLDGYEPHKKLAKKLKKAEEA